MAEKKAARILVVEDDRLSRRLFCEVLAERGHTIWEAVNLDEARVYIREAQPDLVLLDFGLPQGGGERLIREVRSDPSHAKLVMIAVTAHAMRGDRERILATGFDHYISKPISTRTFGDEVERFLPKADADS